MHIEGESHAHCCDAAWANQSIITMVVMGCIDPPRASEEALSICRHSLTFSLEMFTNRFSLFLFLTHLGHGTNQADATDCKKRCWNNKIKYIIYILSRKHTHVAWLCANAMLYSMFLSLISIRHISPHSASSFLNLSNFYQQCIIWALCLSKYSVCSFYFISLFQLKSCFF